MLQGFDMFYLVFGQKVAVALVHLQRVGHLVNERLLVARQYLDMPYAALAQSGNGLYGVVFQRVGKQYVPYIPSVPGAGHDCFGHRGQLFRVGYALAVEQLQRAGQPARASGHGRKPVAGYVFQLGYAYAGASRVFGYCLGYWMVAAALHGGHHVKQSFVCLVVDFYDVELAACQRSRLVEHYGVESCHGVEPVAALEEYALP
ncbi:unknown [Prevotella sp. CAG:1124]|nr:unknown [Prevotella sp. CAG:1124]